MGHLLPRSDLNSAADLAGKYRLIAELGQGGMATVYLAVALGNSGFRKLAVVKVLRHEFAQDEEFIEMFLDEARLCARLSHPNIVHTYDVGVDECGHLIAMEYLDGVSLHAATAKLGRKGGPFAFALQAKVLVEVIEGLRYAHGLKDYDGRSLEIVHRDVTPHNIFITYDGQVKLLDFGIAKAATSSVKTATGVIKGKLTYMAPEQARGDHIDARADLYAVGVMLWEAVAGKRRWPTGLTEPALFTRLATGELPDPPDGAARGLPPEIDAVVMKALAPKPDDRYQSAGEFRDALDAVLRQLEPVSLRDLGALLAKTFDEDRVRIRNVIEEQFRAIEMGASPSGRQKLPAVPHPTFETSSELFGREPRTPLPAAGAGRAERFTTDVQFESQSRRITAPSPNPSPASWPRSRVLFVAGGALLAGAVALAGIARSRLGGSADPVVFAPSSAPSARQAAAPPTAPTEVGTVDSHQPDEPALANAKEPPAPSAAVHVNHHSTLPVASPHADPPHAVTGGSPSVGLAPSPSARQEPGSEAVVHPNPTRPKVQLERDNPWP